MIARQAVKEAANRLFRGTSPNALSMSSRPAAPVGRQLFGSCELNGHIRLPRNFSSVDREDSGQ